ncbi:hypothetical protein BJ166DRAFT_377002 [Pestalotiopsis sp. NC0098]|nr:hypothetical protein BJ166DRAFT_377002 [Pestalotiopsis sp. NC0098]
MTVCTQCLGAYSEHPGGLAAVKGYEQFLTCMSTMQDRVDPIVPPLLVAGLLQHVQTPTSFGIRHRSLLSRKSLLSADERPMIRPSPCGWNRSGEALDLPRDTRSISVEYWAGRNGARKETIGPVRIFLSGHHWPSSNSKTTKYFIGRNSLATVECSGPICSGFHGRGCLEPYDSFMLFTRRRCNLVSHGMRFRMIWKSFFRVF